MPRSAGSKWSVCVPPKPICSGLICRPCPGYAHLKDETTHLTGSLKHRLARSLFLYALCNGRIGPDSTLVEASSGSTAVSEAYFARLLGLRFVAVMPRTTTLEKQAEIASNGGEIHLVDDPASIYATARRIADETGAAIWINSPSRSARSTGAATISRTRFSRRWLRKSIGSRHGSFAVPARRHLGDDRALRPPPRLVDDALPR